LRNYLFILIILTTLNFDSFAQGSNLSPLGQFEKDTVMIGEEIQYSLSYRYPMDQKVIFPDSDYNYFPFEFAKKEFFTTQQLDSVTLLDSVVYSLATFELDSVYYLRVPVFILEDGDSLTYYSNTDSVLFKSVVSKIPDPPALKSNTTFEKVDLQFNYIYFLIAVGCIILILIILAVIFGKRAYRSILIYRMKRRYDKFEKEYLKHLEMFSADDSKQLAEHILTIWKGYMEKLDKQPITKFTTKEIATIYQNSDLNHSLKEIDRKLYGNIQSNNMNLLFGNLKDFSLDRLNQKIQEAKHG